MMKRITSSYFIRCRDNLLQVRPPKVFAVGVCTASLLSSPANADECQIRGGLEHLDSDSYAMASIATGAAGCYRIFPIGKAIEGRIVFQSVAIVSKPQYGSLIQPSISSFDYKPNAGFKGQDKFDLRICGQQNGRSGCAIVSYIVTVN
jgi:hypothetical protein